MSAQTQLIVATAVFFLTYAVIVTEKIHRTIVAFLGAVIIVLLKVLSMEEAVRAIDWNTLGLLTGMMIIVGITRRTGIFEYLAVLAAKRAGGKPVAIMVSLGIITAVVSAFLDNVTTVLLIVPVTLAVARQLKVSPIPFLITEIISSNIGGTATLIGDPPNIMIGTKAHLGFMDFVFNLTPVIVLIQVVTVILLALIYRRELLTSPECRKNIMKMDERAELRDVPLLRKCSVVLGLTILGFVAHQYVHMESSVIALVGASLLLLLASHRDPEEALHAVEWPVIFFFLGLFVVVGALEKVGVIEAVARFTVEVTKGQLIPAAILILWVSAILSAFVDNIPFVATMIPLIQDMGRLGLAGGDPNLLWWALSLGACLGGNGTVIGASANVVVCGIAEKMGFPITFAGYMKVAFPLMLVSIVVSMIYLLFWAAEHGVVYMAATLAVGMGLYYSWKIFWREKEETANNPQ